LLERCGSATVNDGSPGLVQVFSLPSHFRQLYSPNTTAGKFNKKDNKQTSDRETV